MVDKIASSNARAPIYTVIHFRSPAEEESKTLSFFMSSAWQPCHDIMLCHLYIHEILLWFPMRKGDSCMLHPHHHHIEEYSFLEEKLWCC